MKLLKIGRYIFLFLCVLSIRVNAEKITASIDDDPSKGDRNAPVIFLMFSDLECPFCRKFELTTLKKIEKEYIDRGLVLFVFRDFPIIFHPFAREGAKAANCAGKEGKYWEMHELLISGDVNPVAIREYAKSLGLNEEKFKACMDDEETNAEIEKDMKDAREYGITGTPFFIIGQNKGEKTFEGERITGAQPIETFKSVIEKHLRLERIYFGTNEYTLSPSSKEILKRHVEWLKRHSSLKIIIEGHTDERGSAEYNKELGRKRAEEVKRFFIEEGIEEKRIEVISKGEEEPVEAGHDESAWSKNRRVEFIIKR